MTEPQLPLQLQISESAGFDDFIGHDDVVASLRSVSELPGFCYLWGALCSGKSHLLSAYSQQRQKQGDQGAAFSASVMLDTDISELIQPHWCYLVLDDIHLLADKALGERHLFNLFNFCRAQQLSLLVASQVSPRDPSWLLPDLRSRLQSGLTLELSVLSGDQAILLLTRQFKQHGIPANDAVLKFIAGHHATDYASLDALLRKLSALSLRDKRKITVPFVKRAIEEK